MLIYALNDLPQNCKDYICDSQATIDAGKAFNYQGNFSIGTEADANARLVEIQNEWLAVQADMFAVYKNVVNQDGHIEWVSVDLNTEPQNDDVVYRILNVPNGDWLSITGLNAIQTKVSELKQNYLQFCALTTYQTYSRWVNPNKPPAQIPVQKV